MHFKPHHFIFAISFSLLLLCGGESPFKPKDAKISLVLQNSSGKIDSVSVIDTVEKKVRVGMLAYLPAYITSISVTILKAVNDTDTSKIFLSPISWADTQWIEIVFHSTGTRTVTVVVSVQGEPDKVFTASVIIAGKPIFITVDPASAVVNENSPAVLWVKANGTGPLTFQWYKDNALVSGATKDSLIFSSAILDNAGRYTCVIKDQWGDSVSSVSALLTVRQSTIVNHKPQLSVTGTRSITSSQTCVLHLSAADPDTGQVITYKIIKGPAGGVLSDTIYQWTTTSSDTGFDTIVFSATDNGTPPMSDTQKVSINVSPQLVPQTQADFTPSVLTGEYPLTVAFTNNSLNATSYFWDLGDGKTSTEKNPINTFTAPGTYSIKLLATGNSVDSMKKTVTAVRPPPPLNLISDSGVTWIKLMWTKPSGSVSDTVYYAEGDTGDKDCKCSFSVRDKKS